MTARDDLPPDSEPGLAAFWTAALAEHQRWLRTVALARLGSPHAVDEVLQEVAIAALRSGPKLHDPSKAGAWLYRVAVRQALLHRRKLGRRRRLHERVADRLRPSGIDPGADPLEWLLADERRAMIRTALEKLPRREAEILLLKYSENWSYRQLAEKLGTTPGGVESRLHRARAKMRDLLTQASPIEVDSIGALS